MKLGAVVGYYCLWCCCKKLKCKIQLNETKSMSEQLINLIKSSQNEKKNIKIKKGNKCKL